VGNLVKDPHIDKTSNDKAVCNAIVATNNKDKAQFTEIVLWGTAAELFSEMAKKGSKVYIEGSLNTFKQGELNKTEVTVTDFVVLDRLEKRTALLIEDSIK
jgi:single-strand DNA-binding protein